jgi:hypothetical protein
VHQQTLELLLEGRLLGLQRLLQRIDLGAGGATQTAQAQLVLQE